MDARPNADWGAGVWKTFREECLRAPWVPTYADHTPGHAVLDRVTVPEWLDRILPGGAESSEKSASDPPEVRGVNSRKDDERLTAVGLIRSSVSCSSRTASPSMGTTLKLSRR
ncbi:MAG: hypothetical protein ACI8PZ_001359 [Myxococcota bacterium]|jgi:hypothetical protein